MIQKNRLYKIKSDIIENRLQPYKDWRYKMFEIIFKADTPLGKMFDVSLLILIVISVISVMLDSVPLLRIKYHDFLKTIEWLINIIFSIEYATRLFVIKNKKNYIFSFMGIVDFLAIAPYFLSILFPITEFFIVIRMLRLLRIFRIFNLLDYMHDGRFILTALKNGSRKIYIFLLFISIIAIIVGSMMYVIEGGANGFHSIPQSIYWAVVTLTTVGYGDVSPSTSLGKFLSVILMLCGYAIIAVPTGILTSEFRKFRSESKRPCLRCGNQDNDLDARFCKYCGERLVEIDE